jgi:hypothetical protein
MNTHCLDCKTQLENNDYTYCRMGCNHVLCQKCFNTQRINNTYRCQICGHFTENVIGQIGNNVVQTIPIKINEQDIAKHYNDWMEIWEELTKK